MRQHPGSAPDDTLVVDAALVDDAVAPGGADRPWDEADAGVRIEFQLARAEFAAWQAARAAAEQMAAIAELLAEARRHPEVYVPLDDEATDEDVAVALDAAVADLAARLSIAEGTVRILGRQADRLRTRAPRAWEEFREGTISAANARCLADALDSLPLDGEADEVLAERALAIARLAPVRFRERMRVLRERLHPVSAAQRHADAADERRVWHEPDDDGMAWLGVRLAAADAELSWQRIDGMARHLAGHGGDARTLDQLRADVAADILTGRIDPATAPRVSVGVLVPVLTLLGESDAPATLDGRIPIDPETARRLAGSATSFHRILTHPVSSATLDVDRERYRPPADLRRWLALRDGTCRFPGCGRSAKHCDVDHTEAWADGGRTSAGNLAHLSRRHHTLKHRSRWRMDRQPDGTITWTSPTGFVRDADPPPF